MRSLVAALLICTTAGLAHAEDCVDYENHIENLRFLETRASIGGLDAGTVECLEMAYSNAHSQTDKGKVSRVLMANAHVSNTELWAKIVHRHLDEVEQSDPDISYLYANYLMNQDVKDYNAIVRYADMSYARRADSWEGETYTIRTHHLLRLRSVARMQAWRAAAEKDPAATPATDVTRPEDLRIQAHTAAREWLDFDRVSGLAINESGHVCVSTGSEKACGLDAGWRNDL